MEDINLHDYFINKFELDFDNQEASLFCTFEDRKTKGGVKFGGFLASKLEDIQAGNIILDIEEWDIPSFIRVEGEYLKSRKNYAWPMSSESLDDLQEKLINNEYRVWWLSPTYGMGGYIIAKTVMCLS